MLYLKKVKIKNFRQLRDIDINFGIEDEKPLTVVRAENRTGKTTFQQALSWALFGDDAIDNRREYRMHPVDWDTERDGYEVPISVEIQFSSEDENTLHQAEYIVTRECTELIDKDGKDSFSVSSKDPVLLQLQTDGGYDTILNPNAYIAKRLFPFSLKNIFFTDGDKNLSFISSENTLSSRKDRVKKAVKSLMQLEALERASRHLNDNRREISRMIEKTTSAGSSDSNILAKYNEVERKLSSLPDEIEKLKKQLEQINENRIDSEKQLQDAYQKAGGDPSKKANDLRTNKDLVQKEEEIIESTYGDMSSYLENNMNQIFVQFCKNDVDELSEHLTSQVNQGVLPEFMPRLAKERLELDECICGAPISSNPPLLEKFKSIASESLDGDLSMFLLQLKHDLGAWNDDTNKSLCVDEFSKKSLKTLITSRAKQKRLTALISDISSQLDRVEDIDIDSIKDRRDQLVSDEKEIIEALGGKKSTQKLLQQDFYELQKQRTKISKKEGRNDLAQNRMQGVEDMLQVIDSTVRELGSGTLDEVSLAMNSIFKKINVQEGVENSVIEGVSISRDHEIIVMGINGKKLLPSSDLSGAQKRALTLAFIFATVQVSGADLPSVIDTPLGTQSGELKRNMLRYIAESSKQAILFLTSSEIAGVEDIIRDYTSQYWTLSHADHYPRELKNEPPVDTKSSYVCPCDITGSCPLCARH